MLVDIVFLDEMVTDDTTMILEPLELLAKLEVVLSFELLTAAEELVAESIVLKYDLEVIKLTDEIVSELDALLGLGSVEKTDEFEIGYKTLLERILLLEPGF